jgi:hypothetical protein
VLRLVHGIAVATERSPEDTDRLMALMLDGLRSRGDRDRRGDGGDPPEPPAT